MLGTLILLYALDSGQIPTGCYVAAWVLTILKGIWDFAKFCAEYRRR